MLETGLKDKNGKMIKIGDKVKLITKDWDERHYEVCFKTVIRTVKNPIGFYNKYSNVAITGVVFSWGKYELFPIVDENGICDTERMEII